MSYNVNFSDPNRPAITVFDNTTNVDTSLQFSGRNSTNYGQKVAENFLHLLENFSNNQSPPNPVSGQLWYNNDESKLNIWDGSSWKSANSVHTGESRPDNVNSTQGDLWIDTANQQLYLYSGSLTDPSVGAWILVGPSFSSGSQTGPVIETLYDVDGQTHAVTIFYVQRTPIIIVSKDSFVPRTVVEGFTSIRPGVNLTNLGLGDQGFGPKFYGTASSADALLINEIPISSSKFLRSDQLNSTDYAIKIRNDSGLYCGVNENFNISLASTGTSIINRTPGQYIDIQVTQQTNRTETVVRVFDKKVGINKPNPSEALDVTGTVKSDKLYLSDTTVTTNSGNGSFVTKGGVSVQQNLLVGTTLQVNSTSILSNIEPITNGGSSLGSSSNKWGSINATSVVADSIQGTIRGNIEGNAYTATALRKVTLFNITGDIQSTQDVEFDGVSGGFVKTFRTQLTANIIANRDRLSNSLASDEILVYRQSVGIRKSTKDIFVGDYGVPIGAILPFAGATPPPGYLLCDGSEVKRSSYPKLYTAIGDIYGAPTLGFSTFKLPDLRGRFPLGRDNMDNNLTVPSAANQNILVDAGGGSANRVTDTVADQIGSGSGIEKTPILTSNMPEHEHDMISNDIQYYAIRNTIPSGSPNEVVGSAPTLENNASYMPSSGGVKTNGELGQPLDLMNPYLTLNYIIRSGIAEI